MCNEYIQVQINSLSNFERNDFERSFPSGVQAVYLLKAMGIAIEIRSYFDFFYVLYFLLTLQIAIKNKNNLTNKEIFTE